jgi:hypothetical protein
MSLGRMILDEQKVSTIIEFLKTKKKSVEKIEYLGEGAHAEVYVVDRKYVLKFTRNEEDYRDWSRIVGKNFKHVAKCLGAFDLKKLKINNLGLNVIGVAENVKTYLIIQLFYPHDYSLYNISSIERVINYVADSANWDKREPFSYHMERLIYNLGVNGMDFKDLDKDIIYKVSKQLFLGVRELHTLNIMSWDIHKFNIRFDKDKNLKIIDF